MYLSPNFIFHSTLETPKMNTVKFKFADTASSYENCGGGEGGGGGAIVCMAE